MQAAYRLALRWLLGGVAAILIGFALWWTTFVLVPVGVLLVVVGSVKLVSGRARGRVAARSE